MCSKERGFHYTGAGLATLGFCSVMITMGNKLRDLRNEQRVKFYNNNNNYVDKKLCDDDDDDGDRDVNDDFDCDGNKETRFG